MSKSRNRNSLLSTHNRSTYTNSTKDELMTMKYEMNKPDLPLYPLNDTDALASIASKDPHRDSHRDDHHGDHLVSELSQNNYTYPDYKPWKDHTHLPEDKKQQELQRLNNTSFLNKGYFETPIVANEYYSARNLIQATIFSSTDNCNNVLKELSQHLANGYKKRNEVINKIKSSSNNFKIPPRVTLTITKKESWLKDLANPNIPLSKISDKLPHGIRNKVLIESICSKSIPMARAIWFTKCVLYGELVTLRKKHQIRGSGISTEDFEAHWLKEWTQQVSDYIYKYSKEMGNVLTPEKKANYMSKLNYLLTYVQTLYVEGLLDKTFFLSLILKFLKEGLPLQSTHVNELMIYSRNEGENGDDSEDDDSNDIMLNENYKWIREIDLNYGLRLVCLTLMKIFWNDILKFDYLCKEVSELLLLNHYFITKVSSLNNKNTIKSVSDDLNSQFLTMITDHLTYLFELNTNVFIIPNYWILISATLQKILKEGEKNRSEQENDEIKAQYELVKYRNESLVLNMRQSTNLTNDMSKLSSISNLSVTTDLEESDHTYINRSSNDILRFIHQLDNLKLGAFSEVLKTETIKHRPENKEFGSLSASLKCKSPSWRIGLRIIIHWSISSFRPMQKSSENILIVCNFLKKQVMQSFSRTSRSPINLKIEFENEILEIIYSIVESRSSKIIDYNLYVLINELYQLKIITISSYLRKLIASGIFYMTPEDVTEGQNQLTQTHLLILQNLPVLNNRQCDSILKKWTPNGFNFKEKFEMGKLVLEKEILGMINIDLKQDQESRSSSISVDSVEHPLYYFQSLNVGLKFLLINWVTTEIKSSITKSPKLVHITPSTITSLYQFYSMCDNLTVFFKVLVKFILKNEGGMIIFYMDTLYLIAMLVMRHFKLIKYLGNFGSNSNEGSTALELFQLIISNYQEQSSREYDYFRFDSVWKFIDNAVEKRRIDIEQGRLSDRSIDRAFDTDSPLKIANDVKTEVNSGQHGYTKFREDLEQLLHPTPKFLAEQDINDIMQTLDLKPELENQLSISVSDTLSAGSDEEHLPDLQLLDQILKFYFKSLPTLTGENEILVIKLIANIRNKLSYKKSTFRVLVQKYIKTLSLEKEAFDQTLLWLKKICLFELVRVKDVVMTLQELIEGVTDKENIQSLIFNLIFEDNAKNLSCPQRLSLNLVGDTFKFKNSTIYTFTVLSGLGGDMSSLFDSFLFTHHKASTLKFVSQIAFTNTKLFMDELIQKIKPDEGVRLINILLGNNEIDDVRTLEDFSKLAPKIEEFNLPLVQVLLRIICTRELKGSSQEVLQSKMRFLVESILNNLHFAFTNINSYFGELFNYLIWEHKVCVLSTLEEFVMIHTQFNDGTNPGVHLPNKSAERELDLLPVLNDFFKKFSASSTKVVESSESLFRNLRTFLSNLVDVTVAKEITEEISLGNAFQNDGTAAVYPQSVDNIANAVSVLLRILIIHKSTLTKRIIEQDSEQFDFIKNLVALLKSGFLEYGNEKLRILLYDLLLLLKTSLTESLTLSSDLEMSEGTSPNFNLGSIEETPKVDAGNEPDWGMTPTGPVATPGANQGTPNTTNTPGVVATPGINIQQGNPGAQLAAILNLPEPTQQNPFKDYLSGKIDCALTLDEYELQRSGDIHVANESNLALVPMGQDASSFNGFGILAGPGRSPGVKTPACYPYKMRSFEILEDSSQGLNDSCINLQLFDAYTTRENPP